MVLPFSLRSPDREAFSWKVWSVPRALGNSVVVSNGSTTRTTDSVDDDSLGCIVFKRSQWESEKMIKYVSYN